MKVSVFPMTVVQIESLWLWLSLHGFSRQRPPSDEELAGLSRVADAEFAPWYIRLFLHQVSASESEIA